VLLTPGIAAGHPATADAGAAVLSAGGTAADAAVAASLASCVAETVMTGLLGGGHAIWWDAEEGSARLLDFFVTVPGLRAERRVVELVEMHVPFGAEMVHYAVGIGSCAVPGVPAGLGELHRRYGRLPWPEVIEPALRLAREGVEMPPAHASCLAMLAPVMTMHEGARIYSPAGRLLETGERLEQPGLVRALELLAAEGPGSAYSGTIAESLLGLMEERGGLVTRSDLEAYRAGWAEPLGTAYAETRVLTRGGLAGVIEALQRLPSLRGADERARVKALVAALLGRDGDGHTTNLAVGDEAGNACVVTTSLGLGSGDWLPGLDLHLNSMLGETDLLVGALDPGTRMESMMAPTLVLDDDGPVLAAGAAGGTRLRSALVQVLAGIVEEGLTPQEAVDRPRLHPAAGVVHVEPGIAEDALLALEEDGLAVQRWPGLHHYFGGVSVAGRERLGADSRRSGAVRQPR
jgi:gamma-glutamyltranspeptidase / glutathione hydrolase